MSPEPQSTEIYINSLPELTQILPLILPQLRTLTHASLTMNNLSTILHSLPLLRAIFDFARTYILLTSTIHQRAFNYVRSTDGPVMQVVGDAGSSREGTLAWFVKSCLDENRRNLVKFLREAVGILEMLGRLEEAADRLCREEWRAMRLWMVEGLSKLWLLSVVWIYNLKSGTEWLWRMFGQDRLYKCLCLILEELIEYIEYMCVIMSDVG